MDDPIEIIRSLLREILSGRRDVIEMACQQRAKFEGWLKFELAAALSQQDGFEQVKLEQGYPDGGRSDIGFVFDGEEWFVEMKTANTNWREEGLKNIHRPITRNIDGIVEDILILKEKAPPARGMAVFCLFPIPVRIWQRENEKFTYHLQRIELDGGLPPNTLVQSADFVKMTGQYGCCIFGNEIV